jgi:hypothetical protein
MFLIQDGHQTHTHVAGAIARDAHGVIWSPADQTPSNLDAVLRADYMNGAAQAIDPQLYVAPLVDANPKKLADHALFEVPMRPRDFSARNLVALVNRVIAFQADRPVTHLLSPTVPVASMVDRWAEVAANLADTALDAWQQTGDPRPLLISVAIQQSVLADPDNVDALLDELTSYECDGFYLLIERNPSTDPAEAAVLLERALYIIYTLARLNEYAVWIGYAGLDGFVYRAAGAEASAGGWWQKQNWWSPAHWTAGGGGRQPRPRIYLESLLGSLLIDTELQRVARQRVDQDLLADVLGGTGSLAEEFRNGRAFNGSYDRADMVAQLLGVCGALDTKITGAFEADMRRVLNDVADAEVLYRRIREVGVEVEADRARNPLTVWQTAIATLGDRLGTAF